LELLLPALTLRPFGSTTTISTVVLNSNIARIRIRIRILRDVDRWCRSTFLSGNAEALQKSLKILRRDLKSSIVGGSYLQRRIRNDRNKVLLQ
jgi:hypothetical protein